MTFEDPKLSFDPEAVRKTFDEVYQKHERFLDNLSRIVQTTFDYHKQFATFIERLMLINLGTIGLSITALTAPAPRVPGSFPRHTFIWIIAPAWVLLLASLFLCRIVMLHTLVASKSVLNSWSASVTKFGLLQTGRALEKLSIVSSGTVVVDSKRQDISVWVSQCAEKIKTLGAEEIATQKAAVDAVGDLQTSSYTRCALVCMSFGLLLLCISAVRLFLSF